METKIEKPIDSQIIFNISAHNWVMKITENGILFNRELYPDSTPDEFAQAVVEVLEKCYEVKFLKKQPPYDKIGT